MHPGAKPCARTLSIGSGPLLGICLGLQWLFEGSEEAPDLPGIGLLPGHCHLLRAEGLKVPHVGWNTLDTVMVSEGRGAEGAAASRVRVLRDVPDQAYAYFTHSHASRRSPMRAWRPPRTVRRSRRWWNAAW